MKLLCIGDSNTYGYDPRSYIGDRYPAEVRWTDRLDGCEVINCGVNGATVPRGQTRYPGLIRMNEPDLVTVMLGTNDLCSGLSAGQIAGRMEAFLGTIIDAGSPVLLISPPVLEFGDWVMDDEKIEESQDLGEAYRELADRMGCHFADAGTWGVDILFDGVHFSPEGHATFARELQAVLNGILLCDPEAGASSERGGFRHHLQLVQRSFEISGSKIISNKQKGVGYGTV